MIKINATLTGLITLILVSDMSAMTQVIRKSPALTRSAVVAARAGTESAPALRASVSRGLTTGGLKTKSSALKNTNILPKESASKNPWLKRAGVVAAVGTVGAAVMWQAQELVKISNKLFDPTLFDEDLISPEFSRAIVRIYNIKDHENIAQGSGFIVATDQNIFLVTAAHCLLDQAQYYIEVDKVKIKLEPIIVDKNNDVAVLNISLDAINNYYEYTGRTIPYIPFDQLSHVKPEKYEVVALQGHPSYVPPSERGFYRKKFVTLGPETFSIKDTQSANVPGQLLFTFNPETITGASGSPVISIKDKRAQIVGLVSGAFPGTIEILGKSLNRPFGVATSAGVGQLPEYLRQAENIQKEKTQPESWSNYFKRTMWR